MTAAEPITFEDLEKTDVISVELVPERKGLILKHCEYYVSSRRHGTTVTRRYNEFVQLYDVLFAKYPYRAVCRLPPKRVVVGGGSPLFLQRRRAALQRWLSLAARHPVLAHDSDLRAFLCESGLRLEKPRHDEFALAGTTDHGEQTASVEEMEEAVSAEQEQLRLVCLGLGRLFQIFEKVESRCSAGRADILELGAALQALSVHAPGDCPRWRPIRDAARNAANLAGGVPACPSRPDAACALLLAGWRAACTPSARVQRPRTPRRLRARCVTGTGTRSPVSWRRRAWPAHTRWRRCSRCRRCSMRTPMRTRTSPRCGASCTRTSTSSDTHTHLHCIYRVTCSVRSDKQ